MTNDSVEIEAEQEYSEPVPLDERRLSTQQYDLGVESIVAQWKNEDIILPEIQRDYVWTNAKASRLIESLLLNVPIPVVYLAENHNQKLEVIDGHQRLKSIVRYMNNEFSLSGLHVLSDPGHARKKYFQLSPSDQRKIRTRVIRAIIITQESHSTMKFEVFERLNSGAVALSPQEVRNSTHRGPIIELISQLENHADFRSCVGTKLPRKRMADRELVLRGLAMMETGDEYRSPLPRFLNSYATKANNYSDSHLNTLELMFDNACRNTLEMFSGEAFRLPGLRAINSAVAEIQIATFFAYPTELIRRHREELRNALGDLHTSEKFLDNVQAATSHTIRGRERLQQYRTCAQEILGAP